MIDFSIVGANHVSAPLEVREKFAFDEDSQLQILAELASFVEEIALLSTCNRTEVMFRSGDEKSTEKIHEILCGAGKAPREYIDRFFYFYRGRRALVHLFRVASGLDSMVIGETQILGQTKKAFDLSIRKGYSKACFKQIYQRMLNTAKTIRCETSVGKGSVSVASMAVQLAKNIFDTLGDKNVALLGAGEMCELAAEHFVKSGIRDIRIINRSYENALRLAREIRWFSSCFGRTPSKL